MGAGRIWRETSPPPGAPRPFPSGAGRSGISGLPLSGTGIAAAGGPLCGPLAIPQRRARLPSVRLCRRMLGGRILDVVFFHHAEQLVGGDKEGLLVALPRLKSAEMAVELAVPSPGGGGRALDEDLPERRIALPDAPAPPPAATLVVARADPARPSPIPVLVLSGVDTQPGVAAAAARARVPQALSGAGVKWLLLALLASPPPGAGGARRSSPNSMGIRTPVRLTMASAGH